MKIIQIYSYFACNSVLIFFTRIFIKTKKNHQLNNSMKTVACRDFISFRKRFKGGKFWNKQYTKKKIVHKHLLSDRPSKALQHFFSTP